MSDLIVLHVTDSLGTGGTERAALAYGSLCSLSKVQSILSGFNATGPLYQEANDQGIKCVSFNGDPKALARYVRSNGVSVVHFHSGFRGDFKAALEIRKLRDVHLILTNYFGWFDRVAAAKLPDLILFGSRFSARRFREQSGARWLDWSDHAYVSYIPVDPSIFSRTETERRSTRKNFEVPEETILLGRVGRPDPRKLDDFLLRVLRDPALEKLDWKLILVGGLPQSLKHKASRQGLLERMLSTGPDVPATQVAHILSGVDVLVHTSRVGECPGSAVLEAMAASLPVVAQRTPYADDALPELIESGRSGFLEITPGRFARRVSGLALNPPIREEFGMRAKSIFDERFSPSTLISTYLSALKSVITGTPDGRRIAGWEKDGGGANQFGATGAAGYNGSTKKEWNRLGTEERLRVRISSGYMYCRIRENYFRARALGYRLIQPPMDMSNQQR